MLSKFISKCIIWTFFNFQWKEFFLYSGLMFVDMIVFAVLAWFYVPVQQSDKKDDTATSNSVEMKENQRSDEYNDA